MVARAEYDFSAASEEEISLRAGDLINLAPKGDILLLSFPVITVLFDMSFCRYWYFQLTVFSNT